MEIVKGSCHAAFAVTDMTGVGAARRHAAGVAHGLGFDEDSAGRLALVVTELGSNLAKHALRGRLLIASRSHGAQQAVEVLSLDEGPGIADLARSMRDGYSTAGTPGTGLGATARVSDDFEMHSTAPGGTIVLARVRRREFTGQRAGPPRAGFCVGTVALAAPGETACGDGWVAVLDGERAALMMADGLGHGPMAEEAARVAIGAFEARPFGTPGTALEAMHGALRMTRGAAVFTATLDAAASSIHYAGAGNVSTRIVSGVSDKTLLSQHGTVGLQLRRPEEIRVDWPAHACVVTYSDGILTRWRPEVIAPLLARDPSLTAALLVRDYLRGRDDATVMVVRRKD